MGILTYAWKDGLLRIERVKCEVPVPGMKAYVGVVLLLYSFLSSAPDRGWGGGWSSSVPPPTIP